MTFIEKNFVFFQKIHQGVAFICDDRTENEKNSDPNWEKDLSSLIVSLEKLKFDVVDDMDNKEFINSDDAISFAQFENKLINYNSLICFIFGRKSNDQMQSLVAAFEQCSALNLKPKLFFNQLENESIFFTMKFIDEESLKFYYRHSLNSIFIQNLSKILNTIDIDNKESWLSFNEVIEILSSSMFNASDGLSFAVKSDPSMEPDHVKCLKERAFNHFKNGEMDQSLSIFENVLDFYRNFYETKNDYEITNANIINSKENTINASLNIAKTLKYIGDIYLFKGIYEQASIYYRTGLKICTRLNFHLDSFTDDYIDIVKSDILNNLGALTIPKADFENGILYLTQAVKIRKHLSKNLDTFDLAESLNNLGCCYLLKSDTATAVNFLTEAMDMRKRLLYSKNIKIDVDLAQSFNNLGVCFMSGPTYNLEKAQLYTYEGLKMRLDLYKNSDNKDLATSLNNFGLVLLLKGEDLEAANLYLSRGLEMRKRLFKEIPNHPDVIQSMGNCQKLDEIRKRRLIIELIKKEQKQKKTSSCQIL